MANVNVLFWNIQGNEDCLEPLAALMTQYKIDLLLLAECSFSEVEVLKHIGNSVSWIPYQSGNLKFFTSSPNFYIINDQNSNHLVLACLQAGTTRLLLAGLHLESKLYPDENKQLDLADDYRFRIEEQESFVGPRTIIFGDFNLNPYDLAMTHPTRGFSAVATQYLVKRNRNRNVTQRNQKIVRRYFYNPMWSFMGDVIPSTSHLKVPGTYSRSPRNPKDTHWSCIDGVLVSPEALRYFDASSLEILTKATVASTSKEYILFDSSMNTDYSDHLPIRFTLQNL